MSDLTRRNKIRLSDWEIFIRKVYFLLKPVIPKWMQITLRRKYVSGRRSFYADIWPIDERARFSPPGWPGWPEGKQFAVVLTHDIETREGQERCIQLATLEESLGFKSSFNFIARQYDVSSECQTRLREMGFEVGLHGLYHNGNLFKDRRTFERQVVEINRTLKEWKAAGFRCPSMYHNLEWIGELDIEYDSSTFDTDPFEPQPDGVGTIFPFRVKRRGENKGYLELPYTLPQDHTLFVIMGEKTIDLWKKKLEWIADCGGMALLITHPDYMDFSGKKDGVGEYPVKLYAELLEHIRSTYAGKYWNVLPETLVRYWKTSYEITKDSIDPYDGHEGSKSQGRENDRGKTK
jgi:hypothetical protein